MGESMKRVSGRELMQALAQLGWYVERVKGSHHIMRSAENTRITLSVPVHGNWTLPVGTQASILKDAGVSVEDFNRKV